MTPSNGQTGEKTTRVIFRGRVQGVGFRQKTSNFARIPPVLKGRVRNLFDGSVELLVQGPETAQSALIRNLHKYFAANITQEETSIIFHAPMDDFRIDY